MDLKIISIMDEQVAVRFNGKINLLSNFNQQFLGHIIFREGEVINASFNGHSGLKAIYHIFVQEFSLQSFKYIVEPEIVDETFQNISMPYQILKNTLAGVLKEYQQSLKMKPPENVKILIDADFLEDTLAVTGDEFEVLAALTEWSSTYDVYQHCPLLDHEITSALVSLRKKSALKIVAMKNP